MKIDINQLSCRFRTLIVHASGCCSTAELQNYDLGIVWDDERVFVKSWMMLFVMELILFNFGKDSFVCTVHAHVEQPIKTDLVRPEFHCAIVNRGVSDTVASSVVPDMRTIKERHFIQIIVHNCQTLTEGKGVVIG
ncbi:hypothetical protein Nepgr_000430 [Nepenthes gracilis]|uniref:Uncharacterized protein n=1 Tax=Nepenthes gracilis TaxID=150966 RepID=A0AAD3P347_NEPGR|nr:hypothetical protein Nepgr_000430 [Nepenthes gracilis]